MVVNNVILEQIFNEQLLIANDFWVYAVLMFADRDMILKKQITSMNALTAGKIMASNLNDIVHRYPAGHVEYLIVSINPFVEGVSK